MILCEIQQGYKSSREESRMSKWVHPQGIIIVNNLFQIVLGVQELYEASRESHPAARASYNQLHPHRYSRLAWYPSIESA